MKDERVEIEAQFETVDFEVRMVQGLNYANVSGIAKMFPRSTAASTILEFWKKEYGYEYRTK